MGQKSMLFLGAKIWNALPTELESMNNLNTFKHMLEKIYLQIFLKEEDNIYHFY